MKILLDVMGGDNAPDATIKGAVKAINQIKADVILIGKKEVIQEKVKNFYGKSLEEISPRLIIVDPAGSSSNCFNISSSILATSSHENS